MQHHVTLGFLFGVFFLNKQYSNLILPQRPPRPLSVTACRHFWWLLESIIPFPNTTHLWSRDRNYVQIKLKHDKTGKTITLPQL